MDDRGSFPSLVFSFSTCSLWFRSSGFPSTCSLAHVGPWESLLNPSPCLLSQLLMTSYCVHSTVVSHCTRTLVTSVLFIYMLRPIKPPLTCICLTFPLSPISLMYACFQTYCFIHSCGHLFILLSIFFSRA